MNESLINVSFQTQSFVSSQNDRYVNDQANHVTIVHKVHIVPWSNAFLLCVGNPFRRYIGHWQIIPLNIASEEWCINIMCASEANPFILYDNAL